MKSHIYEVFSSLQGEGIYVGVRQIFVRFYNCNLRCNYCDTRNTIDQKSDTFFVELVPGSKKFEWFPNPVEPIGLLTIVKKLQPQVHHSLSLTGGEPLLHVPFLLEFLKLFNRLCPVFLETNGTLFQELKNVLPFIDFISMDIKLPSITRLDLWNKHAKFLEIAREKNVYVKLVLTGETSTEEIVKSAQMISCIDQSIPFVLQPVTPIGEIKPVLPQTVLQFQEICASYLDNVRVIPQVHKMINQL